jgi:hypothetical protein
MKKIKCREYIPPKNKKNNNENLLDWLPAEELKRQPVSAPDHERGQFCRRAA